MDLNYVDLTALRRILEKHGWIVFNLEDQVNIEATLAQMIDLLNAIATAVSAQPAGVQASLDALKAELDTMSAGQVVDDSKLTALQTAADNLQTTLGPVPGP